MRNSTTKARSRKPGRPSGRPKAFTPPKPYKDYPLTPVSNGYWVKRINGKLRYFGRWAKSVEGKLQRLEHDGWKEALALYKAQKEDLYAGREPDNEPKPGELTLAELCDWFLQAKLKRQAAGKMTSAMVKEYKRTTDMLVGMFGKHKPVAKLNATDFSDLMGVLEGRFGYVRQGNEITRVKSVFKWGFEMGKIDQPMRYGPDFVKPDKATLRKNRNTNGKKLWEVEHLRTAIAKATVPMKAWLLLGANCAFYARDCADLPLTALDLNGGWLDWPRGKTGIFRRCKLWPETVQALRDAIAQQPGPTEQAAGLVFATDRGKPWRADTIGRLVSAHVKACGLPDKLNFSWLRHTFRTEADATLDQVAIRLFMGHADPGIDEHYRERIADDRLVTVADHVRAWLYPQSTGEEGGAQ